MKEKRNLSKIFLLAIILISVVAYFFVPYINEKLQYIFRILSSMDVNIVVEYIRSFGIWAAVVSFMLMILQSIVAPIPAFLITFSNAAVFGWIKGALLSWSSAMAGATICFYISRVLGRDVAIKLTSKLALEQVDIFFKRYGKNTILICRLLPFVSFDIVSYAAGITGMKFSHFFIATGIGQLPATIIYSYVGGMLTGGAKLFVTGLLILFGLSAIIVLAKNIYQKKNDQRELL